MDVVKEEMQGVGAAEEDAKDPLWQPLKGDTLQVFGIGPEETMKRQKRRNEWTQKGDGVSFSHAD